MPVLRSRALRYEYIKVWGKERAPATEVVQSGAILSRQGCGRRHGRPAPAPPAAEDGVQPSGKPLDLDSEAPSLGPWKTRGEREENWLPLCNSLMSFAVTRAQSAKVTPARTDRLGHNRAPNCDTKHSTVNRISTFSYELFDGMQLVANIYHCIAPYAIEPDWDDVCAPRLAGFPLRFLRRVDPGARRMFSIGVHSLRASSRGRCVIARRSTFRSWLCSI